MMQIINYSGQRLKDIASNNEKIIFTKINRPLSLDEFNINILDLRDSYIWCNKDNQITNINCINDFHSIRTMLTNSTKTTNIVVYPQNEVFEYNFFSGKYNDRKELKDILAYLQKYMLKVLHPNLETLNIHYENTRTKAGASEISASFYFTTRENELTSSIGSGKTTTLDFREECNLILTTLDLDTYENIINFLKEIKLINEKEEVPEWMNQYKMFDDKEQFSIIESNNIIISESQENIKNALDVIKQSERYKSILYTNGDELVEVVFEVLEKMLGCNLSDFNDEKKEDFAVEVGGIYYIGEIKGVNHNVKSANVSQVDVHYQTYLEKYDLTEEKVKALLIINHQRNKSLESRQPVHENQIKLAERNGSLIIETITLLKLFERFKNSQITSHECIDILFNSKGILYL